MRIFCTAKDSLIFSTKNNSGFDNVVSVHLTNWRLNDIIRLTMLWTTGPRKLSVVLHFSSSATSICQYPDQRSSSKINFCRLIILYMYEQCLNSSQCNNNNAPPLFILFPFIFSSKVIALEPLDWRNLHVWIYAGQQPSDVECYPRRKNWKWRSRYFCHLDNPVIQK